MISIASLLQELEKVDGKLVPVKVMVRRADGWVPLPVISTAECVQGSSGRVEAFLIFADDDPVTNSEGLQ